MNLDKASRLLEKINRLYKNIELDGAISSIERDLMMNYTREFYESFLPEGSESDLKEIQQKSESGTTPVEKPKAVPTPPPADEQEDVSRVESGKDERDMDDLKRRIEENARKAQEKLKQQSGSYTSMERPTTPPSTPPKPTPETSKSNLQETVAENGTDTTTEDLDEVEQLFEFKQARELSEKLSDMPISDLGKAMGLNEKIFTINELFGGNKSLYDEAINQLNSYNSFDQAKEYLIDNIARRFDWTNNEKRKKAKIFIKLVRRRYK